MGASGSGSSLSTSLGRESGSEVTGVAGVPLRDPPMHDGVADAKGPTASVGPSSKQRSIDGPKGKVQLDTAIAKAVARNAVFVLSVGRFIYKINYPVNGIGRRHNSTYSGRKE